ncbi:MAG: sterol desaturase family protein [Bacteroidota bacterium]|nr:sterol desaturase family protein [Bacteroidota bacterium]
MILLFSAPSWIIELKQFQGIIAAGVFLLIYIAEQIIPERKELLDRKHDLLNVLVGIAGLVVIFLMGHLLNETLNQAAEKSFGILNLINLDLAVEVIIQFILIDLYMYWWHRANHVIPFLWRFHSFHHKDEKMSASTALRFHPVELILSVLARMVVFVLLGINPWMMIFYGTILFAVITFHHSNIRISLRSDMLLRFFIASPGMHRIHHSNIRKETDSNYSSVFPYWDRLFGTYTKHPEKEIEFGIEK